MTRVLDSEGLATFLATVKRIEEITGPYGLIVKAKAIPSARYKEANTLTISERYGHQCPPGLVKFGSEVLTEIALRRKADGERERDALLAEYASELEALRADLPRQAAVAAIDVGCIARASLSAQEER